MFYLWVHPQSLGSLALPWSRWRVYRSVKLNLINKMDVMLPNGVINYGLYKHAESASIPGGFLEDHVLFLRFFFGASCLLALPANQYSAGSLTTTFPTTLHSNSSPRSARSRASRTRTWPSTTRKRTKSCLWTSLQSSVRRSALPHFLRKQKITKQQNTHTKKNSVQQGQGHAGKGHGPQLCL